jgi:hypothetical protein
MCRLTRAVARPNRVGFRLEAPAVNVEPTDLRGRSTLKIFTGTDLNVSAVVRGRASSVTYDAALCKTRAAS